MSKKGIPPFDPHRMYFLLRYWDDQWNEMEDMAITTDNPSVVIMHIRQWRQLRVESVGVSLHLVPIKGKAEMISVELQYEG